MVACPDVNWTQKREQSKVIRREATDAIKDFVEYARSQGSRSPDTYYFHFSSMCNRLLLGKVDDVASSSRRDSLSYLGLSLMQIAEAIVSQTICEGISKGRGYKDIFNLVKEKVSNLAKAVGK